MILKSLSRLMLASILATVSSALTFAQTPKDDFWSDEVLNSAASEARRLERDQLETFIEYLATCGISIDSKEQEFACERAKAQLEIKAMAARALQRLIFVVALSDRIVKHSWDQSAGEERARLAKDINRQIDILRRLRTVAGERYLELIGASRRP